MLEIFVQIQLVESTEGCKSTPSNGMSKRMSKVANKGVNTYNDFVFSRTTDLDYKAI